ncbi:MAG: tRNA glutamyl-Q(34) synthetase GluQRS [Notoacmeibacter sp.]
MSQTQLPPVFRFAPSPNGRLHVGHAYSALTNERFARETGGKLLLRIEDVDLQRSKPEFEELIIKDLAWLGLEFDEVPRRQSDHLPLYQSALDNLIERGLAYYSTISRSQISDLAKQHPNWPRDPDGALLPPESERGTSVKPQAAAVRLNMAAALAKSSVPTGWQEAGRFTQFDAALWGDVVLKSRDGSFAYHLAVVVDDAAQGISNIVRGRDLFFATAIHRVLQNVLGLPVPDYQHHDLILDQTGEKLAKSLQSPSLQALGDDGMSPHELRKKLGFNAEFYPKSV